jgi:hypothetical protein
MILIAISHRRKSSVIAILELLYTNLDSIAIISKYKKLPTAIKKRVCFRKPSQGFKDQEFKRLKTQSSNINSAERKRTLSHSSRWQSTHRRC